MVFGRMASMKTWICTVGLWLVGISSALAFDTSSSEVLRYRVAWGPIGVGKANIVYTPEGKGAYTIRADVKDDSSLIDMNDSWEVKGNHAKGKAFSPTVYHVKQAENDYRADKTMTFDTKAKKVVYANLIDKADVAEPLVLGEARDVLSTAYMWRLGGVQEVKKAARVPMVGIKKAITLQREAGQKTILSLGGHEIPVWQVKMQAIKSDGKVAQGTWTIYLRDDASLKPVQIVAATKFGTFRATLKE